MSTNKINCPLEEYNINTVDLDYILNHQNKDDTIQRFYWWPNPRIINSLCKHLDMNNIRDNIIDVGCGAIPFPKATHLLDFNNNKMPNKVVFKLDLDFERFPYDDKFFNYAHCRHTLEDIQNPQWAFNEITRVCRSGYIETPSPLIELSRGVDTGEYANKYRGYIHHRYIVWSELSTNTLHFLPKFPIIEYCINDEALKRYTHIANNYPVYWNNYYIWDETRPPNIVVHRNDIDFNIRNIYYRLLNDALLNSIQYTNFFIETLSK
jgi:hypothetical protein